MISTSKIRKYLGILGASFLTPALTVFCFMVLDETVGVLGLAERTSTYPVFSLEFFWITAQLMLLGYYFLFLLVPVTLIGHLMLDSPLLKRRYAYCVAMGVVAALVFGLFVFGDLAKHELSYERNVWILMLVIGGAATGATNLALYRLISGDKGNNLL